ncbi:1-acyl-sn-glycerol-3-phosphate acyltransferase, partial [Porphyromonadaceae bacterium OttesenSCG-928-L07]|nr:1-acyl-sn-glycerol-3-phosphate acyltransferase [Porphyromonadaceae bacterium OttesenSCG-928-L07]
GTTFSFENRYNEAFDKPAIIICNHQSHLDLMCLMMLTPKLILLTNDWVWNNPFYGTIIRRAEFYPVSAGVDTNLERMKSLVDRGYSIVIFPEGTRSEDCSIHRFHQGAFHYAKELQVDILPVFIHGVGDVLPKKDFMLREGKMYMEIGKRMNSEEVISYEDTKKLTSYFNHLYRSHYKTICRDRQTAEYFVPYVKYKYLYKGRNVQSHGKKTLAHINSFAPYINKEYEGVKNIYVINSGQGEFAWLLALVHKEINIYAYEANEDYHWIASNGVNIPENLHFIQQNPITGDEEVIIDVESIIHKI